jgi:hypothetical protein
MHKLRQSRPRADADRSGNGDPQPPADAPASRDPALRSSSSLLAKALHSFEISDNKGETGGVSDLKAIGDLLSRKLKSSRWTAK